MQQQDFYKEELKKRDNIVLYLCEKVQNMESQIELLRNQQNKSSAAGVQSTLHQNIGT